MKIVAKADITIALATGVERFTRHTPAPIKKVEQGSECV